MLRFLLCVILAALALMLFAVAVMVVVFAVAVMVVVFAVEAIIDSGVFSVIHGWRENARRRKEEHDGKA